VVIVKEILRTYYSCSDDVRLDIDSTISELSKKGILSDIEVKIILSTKEQYSLSMIGELFSISSGSVGRILDKACSKIAKHLGPEYQENKIIVEAEYRLGRKLTKEERSFCRKKMKDFGRNRYASVNIFNFKEKFGESGQHKEQG